MNQLEARCGICHTNFKKHNSRTVCPHCKRIICPKCNKGPICIECFTVAPTEIQASFLKVKRNEVLSVIIPLVLFSGPFLLVNLQGLFNFDVSAGYSILLAIVIIGVSGLGLAGLYIKKASEKWYQENRSHLPPVV